MRDGKGKQRVLLVDDDQSVLDLWRTLLEAEGYSVSSVASGGGAAKLMAAGDGIDLLITDMQLRDMSGIKLAADFAKEKPDLPILFTAASAPHEKLLRQARSTTILHKPFIAHLLLENVRRILNHR
jgi:two-component system cell cycle sensor histidine kinase/response regulator CckA